MPTSTGHANGSSSSWPVARRRYAIDRRAEDQPDQAIEQLRLHKNRIQDVVIAVAASGTTPFTLACMREQNRPAR